MFNKNSKKSQVEATDEINDVEKAENLASELGRDDETMTSKLKVADPFENIPTFTPSKAGFEQGRSFAGTYQLTKRIYSEKFTAGKRDVDGRMYRDLHVLEDSKGRKFGLWSVGQLGYMFTKLDKGTYIKITYTGKSEKSLKAGQSPSHEFKFEVAENYQTAGDQGIES